MNLISSGWFYCGRFIICISESEYCGLMVHLLSASSRSSVLSYSSNDSHIDLFHVPNSLYLQWNKTYRIQGPSKYISHLFKEIVEEQSLYKEKETAIGNKNLVKVIHTTCMNEVTLLWLILYIASLVKLKFSYYIYNSLVHLPIILNTQIETWYVSLLPILDLFIH